MRYHQTIQYQNQDTFVGNHTHIHTHSRTMPCRINNFKRNLWNLSSKIVSKASQNINFHKFHRILYCCCHTLFIRSFVGSLVHWWWWWCHKQCMCVAYNECIRKIERQTNKEKREKILKINKNCNRFSILNFLVKQWN